MGQEDDMIQGDDNYGEEDDMDQNQSEEEVEGDDLLDGMENDYQQRPELDHYEEAGINDDDNMIELDMNERRDIDMQLDREELQRQAMQGRRPGALIDDEFEDEQDDINNQIRQERMRMMREGRYDDQAVDEDEDMNKYLDMEDVRGQLSQWLRKKEVIKYVERQFQSFLRNFKDEKETFVYEEKIHEMCQNNKQSLEVVFNHLSHKYPTLAIWLAEEPALMLVCFNDIAGSLVSELYPDYHKLHRQIFVRVKDLPVEDKLRDLRQVHLNALIKFRGVVTKRTAVFPELKELYFRCNGCQDIKGPFMNNSHDESK
jgi:DNA replication licensing factor MCM2